MTALDSAQELLQSAEQFLGQQKYEQAADAYRRAAGLRPGDAAILGHEAEARFAAGDTDGALRIYDEIISVDPGSALKALIDKSDLLTLLHRNIEAVECLDRALPLAKEPGRIWYRKGLVFRLSGNTKLSLVCFNKAIRDNPEDPRAWRCKGDLFLNAGKYRKALECFEKASACDPSVLGAPDWVLRGDQIRRAGDAETALVCYDRALAHDEKSASAWRGKGAALRLDGQTPAAVECLEKAFAIDPGNAKAMIDLGNCFFDDGKFPEAVTWYRKAGEIKPPEYYAFFNIGLVELNLSHWNEAVQAFGKATEIDASNPDAWLNRGYCAEQAGNRDEALKCYNRHLELKPDSAIGWNNKAWLLACEGRHAEAVEFYDKAISIDETEYLAWNNKAESLCALHKLDEAEACHRGALGVVTDHVEAMTSLAGFMFEYRGNDREALALYSQVVELEPANWGAKASIAEILIKQGQYSKAREYANEVDRSCTDRKLRCINAFLYLAASVLEGDTAGTAEWYSAMFERFSDMWQCRECIASYWNYTGLSNAILAAAIRPVAKFFLLTLIDIQTGAIATSNLTYFKGQHSPAAA
jgi:tetratricopeptide (TPR) repeat protein